MSLLNTASAQSATEGSTKLLSSRGGRLGIMATIIVLLGAIIFFALQQLSTSHAAYQQHKQWHAPVITNINGLKNISQIGSTANVLDFTGKRAMVDPNPYKIAIAPANLSPTLKAGDVLVSNIGNEDKGMTLVKFAPVAGKGRVFNMPAANSVSGPSAMAFDGGKLLVANSTGNDVLILNANGSIFQTLKSPLFNGPWGITVGQTSDKDMNKIASFFTSNKFDGRILRIDIKKQERGKPVKFKVTQIGQFGLRDKISKIELRWLPELKVGQDKWKDVLLAVDPSTNRIAGYPFSSKLKLSVKSQTVFKGGPLNNPGGMTINPLNGDALVVNLNNNNLIEINLQKGTVVGVKQIDPAMVDAQGNNSALFGVAAVKDQQGNLRVYFTNDNTNSLNVLTK
ncbi:hypothetical protein KDH_54900 [Dictyobacter sp. S3.2.2.5]|uniref:Uncharacterized protein n=1 Tax=Dictyobacter halimunensis TaxID=3026934 RepID=A0ABQ6G1L7_9CHLR|nr:hypothetical protein KDH_54900 [Dictyobacter sp. S3.2.2.5]